MIFDTSVAGIPCQCEVLEYRSPTPSKVHGSGFGDIHLPEPEEFEFLLRDRRGYPAPWLELKLTPDIEVQLKEEFLRQHRNEEKEPA